MLNSAVDFMGLNVDIDRNLTALSKLKYAIKYYNSHKIAKV